MIESPMTSATPPTSASSIQPMMRWVNARSIGSPDRHEAPRLREWLDLVGVGIRLRRGREHDPHDVDAIEQHARHDAQSLLIADELFDADDLPDGMALREQLVDAARLD